MAILYAVVARGKVILSEFAAVTGNTGAVARRILEKLRPDSDSRLCLSKDRYIFHVLRSDGLTFLCMANDTFGRRVPFLYLEDIHMRFMKNYGRVAHSALAYAMNDEFSRIHTIMVENIEKILDRGDRIALLVDKTATMQDSAFHFKKQSRRLRGALWMKNAKLFGSPKQTIISSAVSASVTIAVPDWCVMVARKEKELEEKEKKRNKEEEMERKKVKKKKRNEWKEGRRKEKREEGKKEE
ncbi:putative Vesicle-associated membrane protein [Cocos nucifera]|nr:putative Vesicle-associated membrane protein [Cocos nucifera]